LAAHSGGKYIMSDSQKRAGESLEGKQPSGATPRLYTVESANQALPLVRAIVADVVTTFREMSERKERLDRIHRSHRSRGRGEDLYSEELLQVEADHEKEQLKLQGFIDELTALGIEIKDLSRGLVDFRSLMDGREVYLCWLLGEEEVGHWHELDGGFAGRHSLLAGSAQGADAIVDAGADD